jgi:hypothetical protein
MSNISEVEDSVPDGIVDDPRVPEQSLRSILFVLLLLVVGIIFMVETGSVRSQAALWPRGLAVLLIALTALRLGLLLRRRVRDPLPPAPDPAPGATRYGIDAATWRRLFTAGWLIGYCIVARFVGFGPAMLVFVPVYMWVNDFRRPLWIAAITIGSAIAMTLLFGTVVHVPMWDARL